MKEAVTDSRTPGPLSLEAPALQLASLGEWLTAWALSLQAAAEDPAVVTRMGVELEQLGLEMQELVHALRGSRPVVIESLDLQAAAAQALQQWQPALSQAGVQLTLRPGPPLMQDLEAGLLQHALDLLLGHGRSAGRALELAVLPVPPGGATLRLTGVQATEGDDELHWLLLRLLARGRGWALKRQAGKGGTDDSIDLRLAGPPSEDDAVQVEEGLPRRRLDRGLRVLVVDPQEATRVECARLLGQAGVHCDCVVGPAQALQILHATDPGWTALVAGVAVDAAGMPALVQALRERYGLIRWIELVDESYRFDIAVAEGSTPARLGRQDLANTLVTALAG